MPITIKSTELKYKNPSTGQYQGVDVVAETTTSEQCALIEAKGIATRATIPSDYTILSDTVNRQNIVLIGDSYADSVTLGFDSWQVLTEQYLPSLTFTKYAKPSAGFVYGDPTNPLYWPTYINTLPENSDTNFVLFLAGGNDGNFDIQGWTTEIEQKIKNGMIAANSALKTKFPNAKISYGFIGNSLRPTRWKTMQNAYDIEKATCSEIGWTFVNHSNEILMPPTSEIIQTTDMIHPTELGTRLIARCAIQYILGNIIAPLEYYNQETWTGSFTIDPNLTGNLNQYSNFTKTGNIVFFNLCINSMNLPSQITTLGQLSPNCRPSQQIVCWNTFGEIVRADNSRIYKVMQTVIQTDGTILIAPYLDVNTDRIGSIMLTMTYPAGTPTVS